MHKYKVGDLVLYKSMYLYECINVYYNQYKFKSVQYKYTGMDAEAVCIIIKESDNIELIKVDLRLFDLDIYFKSIKINKNIQQVYCGDLVLLYSANLNKSVYGLIYSNDLALTDYGLMYYRDSFLKVFWLEKSEMDKYKRHFNVFFCKMFELELLYPSKTTRGLVLQDTKGDVYINLGKCKLVVQSEDKEQEISLYMGRNIKCFDLEISNNIKKKTNTDIFKKVDFSDSIILNYVDISYINTIDCILSKHYLEYIINMNKRFKIFNKNNKRTIMKFELIK